MINIFTHPNRKGPNEDLISKYKAHFHNNLSNGLHKSLIYNSTNDSIDPWFIAEFGIREFKQLPLLAINPVYQHPYSFARMLASMQELHNVDIAINWIIGDAKSDDEKLGDRLTKNEKYKRLEETILIVNSLLSSKEPCSYEGINYNLRNLSLLSLKKRRIENQFLAGHSLNAKTICERANVTQLVMLSEDYIDKDYNNKAVAFGIICEKNDDLAIEKAKNVFPKTKFSEYYLALSKQQSGSVWKNELFKSLKSELSTGFSTMPLYSFSETPFFIGSFDRVFALFKQLRVQGVNDFVITLADESDYYNLSKIKETLYSQAD